MDQSEREIFPYIYISLFQVSDNLANYRTLLIDLLMKIKIKSPESLHNKTIGEMFAAMDWVGSGAEINRKLLTGEHNSLCLAHGRQPLSPYQSFSVPEIHRLPPLDSQCPRSSHVRSNPSYRDLFNVQAPLRSSMSSLSTEETKVFILVIGAFLFYI